VTGTRVCALDDITPGGTHRVVLDGVAVALVRIDDSVYAIGDRCTHQDISLSEGEVDADALTLECWKHGSTFSLTTGEPTCLPATRPVPVYTATVSGGDVYLEDDA
jgi:3-phenylpropionate/trans-cinnamate dioxygenase ferredoxin component